MSLVADAAAWLETMRVDGVTVEVRRVSDDSAFVTAELADRRASVDIYRDEGDALVASVCVGEGERIEPDDRHEIINVEHAAGRLLELLRDREA